MYVKERKSKYCIYLYTFKLCTFIELWCTNNKKCQYLHWLVAIFVLKWICTIKYFACIPLNTAHLLSYGVKSQYSQWLLVIFVLELYISNKFLFVYL